MSCPNKNLPIYKTLEAEFGEIKALIAFKLNSDDIPTVEKARQLLRVAPMVANADFTKYTAENLKDYYDKNETIDLLNTIIENTKEKDTRLLAQSLLRIQGLEKIKLIIREDKFNDSDTTLGEFDTEGNFVEILKNLSPEVFETVFLHEVVHSVTVNEYTKNSEFASKINELYAHALIYKDKMTSRGGKLYNMYGMTNAFEFMSEGLSNPDFIAELSKINTPFKEEQKNRNIFQELLELISKMLIKKFKNAISQSVYYQDNLHITLVNVINNYVRVNKIAENFNFQFSRDGINSINDLAISTYGYWKGDQLSKYKADRIADAVRIDPQFSGWFAKLSPVVDFTTNTTLYTVELLPNSLKAAEEQHKESFSKESVNQFLDALIPKFEGLNYVWIKPSDLNQIDHRVGIDRVNAFAKGKTLYLVEGRVGRDTALEELLHPFVEKLYQDNPELFEALLNEVSIKYASIALRIRNTYKNTSQNRDDIDKEIVTRGIQISLADELATNEEHSQSHLVYLLKKFYHWLAQQLQDVFGVNMSGIINVSKIPKHVTLGELADIINTQNIQIETAYLNTPAYNLSEMEEDEKKFGSRQKNITRIETQINMIDDVMSGLIDDSDLKKIETLEVLKNKLEEHLQDIIDGKTTVSVTKLKGGGALDLFNQNPKFQNFGTFLHDGLEKLQKEYLTDPNILPSRRITESFLDELLNDQLNKLPADRFTIESGATTDISEINRKEVLSMLRGILQHYESYIAQGYTIIPELTISGLDKAGRLVIGRIDSLAISKDGSVKIIDLKTKKLNEETSWPRINAQLEKSYRIEASSDSDADFFLTPQMANRNAYQEWDIQLGLYEQIFKQMGINVADKQILALIYMGENVYTNTPDSLTNVYDFKYKSFMIMPHYSNAESYQSASDKMIFEKYQTTVRKVIPIQEATIEEKKQKANIVFDLTAEQQDNIINRMKHVLDTEINKVSSTISKYRKEGLSESEMVKSLSERAETLKKIRDTINKDNYETVYKLSLTLQYLDESYDQLTKTITEIKKITDSKERAKQLDALRRRATGLNYFIDEFERTLISVDPTKNKEAIALIGRIKSNMQSVMIAYNELGADFMIKIIQSMEGTRRETVMTTQRKEAIEPRIKYLEERLQRLKDGTQNIGDMRKGVAFWALGNLKNIVRGIQKIPGQELNQIRDLELQIKTLKLELEGIKLAPLEIKQYVEGILEDKNTLLYLGKGVTKISDIIAAASNSDLGVSSFANFLKASQQEAQREYVNFIERNKFQKEIDDFTEGRDITEASKRITEVRTIIEKDDEDKDVPKEVLSLIDPIQQEWRDTFTSHYKDLRSINEEIKNAGTEADRKLAVKKRATLVENHRKWRLEHSQMPLKDEVYRLENLLPAEYRQKRSEILDEINSIKARPGYNNEELLTEEDRQDIAELEVDLQRLKIDLLKDKGQYEEYLKQLDLYYAYDVNINFFNRLKNSKMVQYGETSDDFKKWMEENTVKVANEAYYDEIEEIYEEMFSIIDKDDEMADLKKQQREILAKVRRKGAADVRFLTEEEKTDYMNFETIMAEMREDKVKLELDPYERNLLSDLRTKLNSIRTATTNPYYQMDYSSRKQVLDQKYGLYKQAEEALNTEDNDVNKNEFDRALGDYYNEEESFETWYNTNHYDIYESRLVAEKPLNPKPLPFNVISLPTNEKHYDVKPISKYSIRRIKDEAKNPSYQTDVYGVPMPKALSRDEATGEISIVDQQSRWVNPAYRLLTANAKDFHFYNFLTNTFIKTQSETYGNKLGYLIPGYEDLSVKIYQEKGLKEGIKENFSIWKQKNLTVNNPYDYNFNEYGSDIERIRFKHNRPLPIAEQSKNAVGCILKWYEEAFINKNVGQIQPEVNAALSYLESMYKQLDSSNVPDKEVRKNELQNVIGVLRNEYNKIIKGETKTNQGSFSRIGDLVLRGIGISRMGLDIPNQIGNLFSGNVQIFLGGHKTGQYNNQDLIFSKKKIWGRNGLMNSLVDDISKISGKSHMTNMYLYFNPMQKMIENTMDKSLSRADRVKESIIDLEFAFWVQDKGEIEIASTIWLSMMNNRRVELTKDDGTKELIPLFEAYESNADGEIVLRKNVKWSKADENEFYRNMYSEIRRTQGNYAQIDKTKVEQNVLGRFAMFFRKYLAPAIQNRFGSRRENHEGSEIAMGYYNGLYQAIKYYGYKEVFMSIFSKNTKVEPFYRQRAQWAARELAVSLALMLLGNALSGLVTGWKDKDDEVTVSKILVYNMLAVFLKVERETRGLVPLPGIGGFEGYLTQLSSFTNAGSDFVKLGKLASHAAALGIAQASDDPFIQKAAYYQRKSGYWEEGDAKVRKDMMDVTGYGNIYNLFNPVSINVQAFKRR